MGLFGFGKKRFHYNCPVCQREYWADFNPSDLTEFDRQGYAKLSETACGFCKTKIHLYFAKENKSIIAKDAIWDVYETKFWDEQSDIDARIDELQEAIEELEAVGSPAQKEKGELQKMEAQLKKRSDQFDKKEAEYLEKQDRWTEKYDRSQN